MEKMKNRDNFRNERASTDPSVLLTANADKTAELIITQFMLFMQHKSIWPCHEFIGDDPQALTPSEAMRLKCEYIESLKAASK